MAGTSSRATATSTSPTGEHGMRPNVNVDSRGPILPVFCLTKSSSMLTVSTGVHTPCLILSKHYPVNMATVMNVNGP